MDLEEVERKNAMALDNKRKVMRSNIFVGDDSNDSVPVSYQPNREKPKNKNPNQNNNYNNNNNNDRYPSNVTIPSTYQSPANGFSNNYQPKSYPKQPTISTPLVDNTPINIPQIEKIDSTPVLPTLTPFPDFRFDAVSPVSQIDLDVKPKESLSSFPRQNERTNFNPVVFNIGDELKKIREDLAQESSNNSKRLQQILSNNKNFQLTIEPIRFPNSTLSGSQSQKDELPQITTSSQFILPDGTTIQNS